MKLANHRCSILVVTLVLMIFFLPAVESTSFGGVFVTLMYIALTGSAIFAVSGTRMLMVIGLWIASPVLVTSVLQLLDVMPESAADQVLYETSQALFLAYAIVVMTWYLFHKRKVDFETLAAALSLYLLIGILWAMLYSFVERAGTGAFSTPLGALASDSGKGRTVSETVYFSFTTLTTLGYGDISPRAGFARSLAILEAIIGQLLVAVLIARLVGLQIAGSGKSGEKDDPSSGR